MFDEEMFDAIDGVKARARVLHKKARASDATALSRLRRIPELSTLDDAALASSVKRRHCLTALAMEMGFTGWPHARTVLDGAEGDFGTLLHVDRGGAYWNIWSASYEEARTIREEHGGYLLAYRRHFLIVERYYIEGLGLDPDDEDWERIGRDWVRPRDPEARRRLYAKLIQRRLAPA